MNPVGWQRVEAAAGAVVALGAAFVLDGWWWPLALFLVFDLSAIGYAVNPRVGATLYNAGHSLIGPAAAGAWALASWGFGVPGGRVAALIAVSWLFHVGVDRALGYGFKESDDFKHTHLGWIGGARAAHTTKD
ncbi:DUF4260 domain-containing protein [Demequina sp. B12]|uniref:DUF4260 family protein n=1 Tax=Demequina sp. B12 TaxID=2992757 RepID=UPI00237AD0DE|nr:DUF4260 family protein [Demequina sp. B12]MDE0573312.1 DUF4260 domain-containing protein [Demequina sp. B12]